MSNIERPQSSATIYNADLLTVLDEIAAGELNAESYYDDDAGESVTLAERDDLIERLTELKVI